MTHSMILSAKNLHQPLGKNQMYISLTLKETRNKRRF